MIYCFDLDGTLCDLTIGLIDHRQQYDKSYPKMKRI